MNQKNQLQLIIADIGDLIQEVLPHRIFRRVILILGGVGLLAIFSGLVWWYFRSERDAAYNDLTYLMIDLKNGKESIETDWTLFQEQFLAQQANRGKAKNSLYLPLLHVELLIQQERIDEARVLLEQVLPKLADSPLFSHAQTLYALLLLDGSTDQQNQGLVLLQDIANKEDNYASEYAAYQLGYYHFIHGDFAKAKAIWQPLVDQAVMAQKSGSVWASRAEEKLNQMP